VYSGGGAISEKKNIFRKTLIASPLFVWQTRRKWLIGGYGQQHNLLILPPPPIF